jgi:hypothetical protein
MRKAGRYSVVFLAFFSLLLGAGQVRADNNVRAFDALEFQGLHVLSKYVLAQQAGVTVSRNQILVNVEKLKHVLNTHEYIKNYKLIDKNNKITIVVVEQNTILSLAIAREKYTELYELNACLQVVATGTIYNGRNPLVLLTEDQYRGKIFSKQLKTYLGLLLRVHNQLPVWNEIKSIDLRNENTMQVRLKARLTLFNVAYSMKNFVQLQALVGYLDAMHYYPARLTLHSDFVVIGGSE